MLHLIGAVPKLKKEDALRLAAYVVQGNTVLAKGQLAEDGNFRVALARNALACQSPYALNLVIAPASLGDQLEHLSNAPRLALKRAELEKAEQEVRIKAAELIVSDAVLKLWWSWCRQYCVSGTLVGPNGCPVPAADVTVYSVGHYGGGYSKVPRATVTTDPNGNFTACFEWCSFRFPCWPCGPFWWDCWPWWWEWDILHVIELLEKQPPHVGPGPVERIASHAALIRPDGKALARGQGFPQALRFDAFTPDAKRTELIKRKFADARIRAIFPWWWWCCNDPNVIFSASQGGNLILNEAPAIDTRWCLDDGSTVSLIANDQAVTACPPGPTIESGFAWTRVGLITVDHINQGYAQWWGGDATDAAFAGTLDIYGGFAPGTPVSYYQVDAGQWGGDPARGGSAPLSGSPLAADLYNYVFVYDGAATLVYSGWVKMGPFNQSGLVNLYATEEARQSGPTPPGLLPFPVIPAGGFALWAYRDRKVYTGASTLIGGNPVGAVDLTLIGYNNAFAPVALTPDAPLTLTIDNIPLTNGTAHINGITAYTAGGGAPVVVNSGDCPAYDIGPGGYVQVSVTVTDTNGHLYGYYLAAEHGHGVSDTVSPPGLRGYVSNPLVIGSDPNYAQKSWIGGTEVMTYYPPTDCCYEFRIRAGKRVTDGYSAPTLADYDFQTIGLKVSS